MWKFEKVFPLSKDSWPVKLGRVLTHGRRFSMQTFKSSPTFCLWITFTIHNHMWCRNYADPVLIQQDKGLRNSYAGIGYALMFWSWRESGKIKGILTICMKCVSYTKIFFKTKELFDFDAPFSANMSMFLQHVMKMKDKFLSLDLLIKILLFSQTHGPYGWRCIKYSSKNIFVFT